MQEPNTRKSKKRCMNAKRILRFVKKQKYRNVIKSNSKNCKTTLSNLIKP